MLSLYALNDTCLTRTDNPPLDAMPAGAVWFDLVNPTPDEDKLVERLLGVAVPTREEMQEIEVSSRLYVEDDALYMTATLICRADTPQPITTPVTFILAGQALATVRYDTPQPFALTGQRVQKPGTTHPTGLSVMLALLDSIIDRVADVLERGSAELDELSRIVFDLAEPETGKQKPVDYTRSLKTVGRTGTLVGKVEESLVSLQRLISFLSTETGGISLDKDARARLKLMQRDIKSISEFANSLDNKLVFVLDATLGLVSLQQNNIVKIFSILAVIFMPPTLIASIYGMNFEIMPELKWTLGYPFALGLMVAAALVTYVVFRWRKWL